MPNILEVTNTVQFVSSATEPTTKFEGLIWYDTVNLTLNYYDGSNWILIG